MAKIWPDLKISGQISCQFFSHFLVFSCSYMGANGQKCLFFLKNPGREIYFIFPSETCSMNQKWTQKISYFPLRREIWDLGGKYEIFFFFFKEKMMKKCSYKGKVGRVSRDAARSEKFKHRFSRNLYVVFDIFNYGTKLFFNFLIASQSTFC